MELDTCSPDLEPGSGAPPHEPPPPLRRSLRSARHVGADQAQVADDGPRAQAPDDLEATFLPKIIGGAGNSTQFQSIEWI